MIRVGGQIGVMFACLGFGPGPLAKPPLPDGWTTMCFGGLTVEVGPPGDKNFGLGGFRATAPIKAFGGTGTAKVRVGLTKDVDAILTDVVVKDFLMAIGDSVPELARCEIGGKIHKVELRIRDKDIKATLYWLGGLIEVEGKLRN